MIFLLLSVLSSASLFICFKAFDKYKVDTFQAIVVNYLVAFACGFAIEPITPTHFEHVASTWLPWAAGLGLLFIVLFYLIAITTQRISVAVATIATKMSIVIPVVAAVPLYGDSMPILKVIGIVLALTGVVLASWTKQQMKLGPLLFILPAILFAGNGSIDLVLKYVQHHHLGHESPTQFSSMIFGTAGAIGILALIAGLALGKIKLRSRNVLAGIVLGLPNFGSIYFLLKALANSSMQSSEIFPLNNMGVVLFSALGAALFFGEKGNLLNRIGVVVSIAAIALIAFHGELA